MSKEFQNHIFEPFTQETGGARSVYGGTGLGMPITKKLVEKMGGTIKFESEKNVGTTWLLGQFIYVILVTVLYTVLMLLFTAVLCMKKSYPGNLWSETARCV